LHSISTQTYRNFECLVLISEGSNHEILHISRSYPSIRIFEGSFNKSEARNFLASEAKGQYMLYVDVDMELSPNLLEDCIKETSKSGSKAVIAPSREAPRKSFWAKCRSLEREIILSDKAEEIPLFIDLNTFRQVGGFDERLDPLDDWGLTLRLRDRDIRFGRVSAPLLTRQTTDLAEMFRRKYVRGQLIPLLLREFPNAPQLRFGSRFADTYLRNWRLLIKSPILTVGLSFLKLLDMLALTFGRMLAKRPGDLNGTHPYFAADFAKTYDNVRLGDNFNRYKHYAEIRSTIDLLQCEGGSILEVGCGTGRVTKELAQGGFRILPTDPSPPMLKQYVAKSSLPPPVNANGIALPFSEGCFNGSCSLRVIWHLPTWNNFDEMLMEMARVSSTFVIVDVANERKWNHPLIRPLAAIYFAIFPQQGYAHKTSRLLTLEQFTQLTEKFGLSIDRVLPLDVLSPIWLRLLPTAITRHLYPMLYRLELAMSKLIPPGRWLVRLTKGSSCRAENGCQKNT
jgi:ubiquinone/menaquinone biosynthesis C-methylase UbiE